MTHDELRALALEAASPHTDPVTRHNNAIGLGHGVLALLDDLARLRAAARAFCEERTEAALIALMSEVER
jgi:hypothetical protein